jgi:hypothetical protein
MANGAKPRRTATSGPEFFFYHNKRRVWIEATAPSAGTGADAVTEHDPGDAFRVPLERILLRYTAALNAKRDKLASDIEQTIVGSTDHYVLAINGRGIPYAPWGNTLPYMVQAYLPIGPLVLTFDRNSKRITDRSYERQEAVSKRNGAQVSTMAFLDPSNGDISAVLHSSVDAANLPRRLGGDFYVLHNPNARNPLPLTAFAQWRQYVFVGNQLMLVPPSRRTSRLRMSEALRAALRSPPTPFDNGAPRGRDGKS